MLADDPPVGDWSRIIRTARCSVKPVMEMCEQLVPLYSIWNDVRGARPFPSKIEMLPQTIRNQLKDVALLRALDGGSDFEFRIVGDAIFQQFGERCDRKKTSELGLEDITALAVRPVVHTSLPRLIEYSHQFGGQTVIYHEALFLPLGQEGSGVDHILTMGANFPRKHRK